MSESLELLGIPVEVKEWLPPGVIELKTPNGSVRAGIGVPWIYEALANANKRGEGQRGPWYVRSLKDLTDNHDWPGWRPND